MPNEIAKPDSKKLIQSVFDDSMTEENLKRLRRKYPKKLIMDMTNDTEFKAARKIKTEMNKTLESIKRARIDHCNGVKTKGDSISSEVTDIYSVVVIPFEKEEARRVEEKAKEEKKKKELLNKQSIEIHKIKNFAGDSIGKSSDYIQNLIEAVDLIETESFHKELIHDVIEVKKETLTTLTINLNSAIASEALEEERLKLEEQRLKLESEQKEKEAAAAIQEKINNLKMIPTNFFDKTSEDIRCKIDALNNFTADEARFKDRVEEVNSSVSNVISQLENMFKMKAFEESQAEKEKEAEKAETDMLDAEYEAFQENQKPQKPVDEALCEGDESSYTPIEIVDQGPITIEEIPLTEKTTDRPFIDKSISVNVVKEQLIDIIGNEEAYELSVDENELNYNLELIVRRVSIKY